jgi:hypothetical protein
MQADKPPTYLISPFYLPFVYLLPADFTVLKDYTVWFDDYNMKAISFTFENATGSSTTDIFGNTTDSAYKGVK